MEIKGAVIWSVIVASSSTSVTSLSPRSNVLVCIFNDTVMPRVVGIGCGGAHRLFGMRVTSRHPTCHRHRVVVEVLVLHQALENTQIEWSIELW